MSTCFSVFNCHINDALTKSIEAFTATYNQRKFDEHIRPHIQDGVMGIFESQPNRYTKFFVFYIQRVVNSR